MRCGIANASGLAQDIIPFTFRRQRRREVALDSNMNSSKSVQCGASSRRIRISAHRPIDGTSSVSDLFRKKSSKVLAPLPCEETAKNLWVPIERPGNTDHRCQVVSNSSQRHEERTRVYNSSVMAAQNGMDNLPRAPIRADRPQAISKLRVPSEQLSVALPAAASNNAPEQKHAQP